MEGKRGTVREKEKKRAERKKEVGRKGEGVREGESFTSFKPLLA